MTDRIMAVLDGCLRASPKERLSKLINDTGLPADIRMAVAQVAFPDRTSGVRRPRQAKTEIRTPSAASSPPEIMSQAARDALLGIVSDASASAKSRRKAAMKLATYFLPKKPVNKGWGFTADKYGFAINAEIAREYRTIDFELRDLKRHPNRDFPEIAQRIRKLQARFDAIRQRLQCPPPKDAGYKDAIRRQSQSPLPMGYGDEEFAEDWIQLETFARKRKAGIALSTEEDAEEAHRNARFDCYAKGSERAARRRREHLQAADYSFRKGRFFKDPTSPPLSRKARNDLRLLRWLYPEPHHKSDLTDEARDEADANKAIGYPFCDEKPAADGNYYPYDSKLRPASDDEAVIFEEYTDIPPYCCLTTGQPPVFSYEPPPNSSSDKSGPSDAKATPPST